MRLPQRLYVVLAGCYIGSVKGFLSAERVSFATAVHSSQSTLREQAYSYEVVEDDDRVLDVASFRNDMTNPAMMVERAQEKLNSVDNTEAALNGLKVGLLYVGPLIAAATYAGGQDIVEAGTNYAVLGGGVGGILAANSLLGKSVHVPDIPEATNRIIVDYSEGLLRKQDVGFVAISEDPIFTPARGVMATVDAQLRNSDNAHIGARTVPNLPAHMHIKNMEVHSSCRRQGVGRHLLDKITSYAKEKTDAKALSLEVEASNSAAVNLYKGAGFVEQPNPSKLSPNLFLVKTL